MSKISFVILLVLIVCVSCNEDGVKHYISNPGARFNIDLNPSGVDNALMNGGAVGCYVDNSIYSDYKKSVSSSKNVIVFSTPRSGSHYEVYGYSGVLIYNTGLSTLGTNQSLVAYDLCCPVDDRKDIRIIPIDGYRAKCLVCESEYSLFDGIPTLGKAKNEGKRLQIYPINMVGANKYQVVY